MDTRIQDLDKFFDNYAERFNEALSGQPGDVEETAACFAQCFVAANPAGVLCGRNDDEFRKVIPQGHEFYRSIGITRMDIRSKDTTILDAFHAMTKVSWRSEYLSKESEKCSIEFENIYFVQSIAGSSKIFAYITGDEQAVLRERGLI